MAISMKHLSDPAATCSNCRAYCCRLEVIIITDTGVPDAHISRDEWGAETMLRLDDSWCSAIDRETFTCSIYENRPLICREFEMGSYDCGRERAVHVLASC
jgi:Fe-S-cluster containining protein